MKEKPRGDGKARREPANFCGYDEQFGCSASSDATKSGNPPLFCKQAMAVAKVAQSTTEKTGALDRSTARGTGLLMMVGGAGLLITVLGAGRTMTAGGALTMAMGRWRTTGTTGAGAGACGRNGTGKAASG